MVFYVLIKELFSAFFSRNKRKKKKLSYANEENKIEIPQ